jgi:MFS family permease
VSSIEVRPAAGIEPGSMQTSRLLDVMRSAVICGVAGVVAGVIAAGVFGRLAMRFAAMAGGPAVHGLITENGNTIGRLTFAGTMELLVFGGILGGLIGGAIFAVIRPWTQWAGRWRAIVTGVAALAVGGDRVIDRTNSDFSILHPAWFDLLLFAVLFLLYGVIAEVVAQWLGRRPARLSHRIRFALYVPALGLGGMAAMAALQGFFSAEGCFCPDPPVWTGAFLLVTAAATVWSWVTFVRAGAPSSPGTRIVGWIGLAGATLAGGIQLAGDVWGIL